MDPKKAEEFYSRLKEQLEQDTNWPAPYLYKFIVPTDAAKIRQIEDIFNNMGAVINSKQSKKGTYTSVSINVRMPNPAKVIEKYIEVSAVDGVISL